jgi:hypothetical protein
MMYNVLLMYVQKDARASHAVFAELISQLWKLREKTCLKSNHSIRNSIIFYPSLSKFQYYKSSNLQAHASFIKVSKALPSCRWNIWTIWSNRHSQGIAHQWTSFRIIPNRAESSCIRNILFVWRHLTTVPMVSVAWLFRQALAHAKSDLDKCRGWRFRHRTWMLLKSTEMQNYHRWISTKPKSITFWLSIPYSH